MGKIDDHIKFFLAFRRIRIDRECGIRITDDIGTGNDHGVIIFGAHVSDDTAHTAHTAA